jgi:hypothetical protein
MNWLRGREMVGFCSGSIEGPGTLADEALRHPRNR